MIVNAKPVQRSHLLRQRCGSSHITSCRSRSTSAQAPNKVPNSVFSIHRLDAVPMLRFVYPTNPTFVLLVHRLSSWPWCSSASWRGLHRPSCTGMLRLYIGPHLQVLHEVTDRACNFLSSNVGIHVGRGCWRIRAYFVFMRCER